MKNNDNMLTKDYLYCDGYYRKKPAEEAAKIVDGLLMGMINDWNEVRRDTPLHVDDEIHEKIDALRDVLYYATKKEEYDNDIEVRERLHENYLFWKNYGAKTEDEFEELRKDDTKNGNDKLSRKLQKKKLARRRAGRVIIKEELYGEWAFPYLDSSWKMENLRSRA